MTPCSEDYFPSAVTFDNAWACLKARQPRGAASIHSLRKIAKTHSKRMYLQFRGQAVSRTNWQDQQSTASLAAVRLTPTSFGFSPEYFQPSNR